MSGLSPPNILLEDVVMDEPKNEIPARARSISKLVLAVFVVVLAWMFASAKEAIPEPAKFPFFWFGPVGNLLKALAEELFGATIGAIVVFWLFEKQTMKKIEDELRNPLTFLHKLRAEELFEVFALRMNKIRGIPVAAAGDAIRLVDEQFNGRFYAHRYKARYALGKIRENNYREIVVTYEYSPMAWTDRQLRFRCYLPKEFEVRSATLVKGYELSWAFLSENAPSDVLPADAFRLDKAMLIRGDERIPIVVRKTRDEPHWVEFESEELRGLSNTDVLAFQFRVLQANRYKFVSDVVTDCILDYAVECDYKKASDVDSVFPSVFVLSSAAVTVSSTDSESVSVTTRGWALPQGGVTFSWGETTEVSKEISAGPSMRA
jgi:hypothetical protein